MKSLKIVTVCENCPADHLKAEKIVPSLFAILCFFPLSQIWSNDFFCYQHALERAQIFSTLQQILGKRDKSVCFACLVLCSHPDLARQKTLLVRLKLF